MTLRMIHSEPLENVLPEQNNPNWYVVQTQVKREQEVKAGLLKKGYEVFLPLYVKRNKKADVTLPLFAGYLFVTFDGSRQWQEIHRMIGVSRLLGYDAESDTIAPCRDKVIPSLRAFADDDGIVDMQRAFPTQIQAYTQGEHVQILAGMFKDQTATYWNSTKNGAMVILSLLNRPVRVILRNDEITQR